MVVILGLIVAYYNLSSRICVTSHEPISRSDPFSTPFQIRNEGYLPIYDVTFSCVLRRVEWAEGGGVINIATTTDAPPIHKIDRAC